MIHLILPVGRLACNCSIFGDEASRDAIVIDPGDDIDQVRAILDRHEFEVSRILFTHAHIDHIGRASELKKATGATTYLHRNELPVLASIDQQAAWLGMAAVEKVEIDEFIEEGDAFDLAGTEFQALFTPGHSPGSFSLYIPGERKLIGGDTLFRDSIGRTDLPGGNHAELLASIRDKILTLGDDVTVVPGHGPATTIGHERRFNCFLQGL